MAYHILVFTAREDLQWTGGKYCTPGFQACDLASQSRWVLIRVVGLVAIKMCGVVRGLRSSSE